MSEEIVLQEHQQISAVSPLKKKSIAEIREDETYRKAIMKEMIEGKAMEGAHYGKVPGVKNNLVFKDGIQFLADTYYLGYGTPTLSKEMRKLTLPDGTVIEHFDVTAMVPIYNRATGDVITIGAGSCSTLEDKYRFRGEERHCPKCGKATIIKGKADFGGGWICFAKKGGCGAKFKDGDPTIEDQPIGKIENLNPTNVLDTVIAMAIKRAKGRNTLDVTGMNRFFQLPPDLTDEGPDYDGSRERDDEPLPQREPKQTLKRNPPDPEEAEMLHQKLLARLGDEKAVSSWVQMNTKGKFSDVHKLETDSQLQKLIETYAATDNNFSLSKE